MKCEVCRELLEEYLDGELAPQVKNHVDAHLTACIDCSESLSALTAEQELFARYDREIEVPPFLWTRVAAHTVSEPRAPKRRWFVPSFTAALAVLLIAIAIGVVYRSKPKPPAPAVATRVSTTPTPDPVFKPEKSAPPNIKKSRPRVKPVLAQPTTDQSDVLSSDLAYLDME